jgi:hypothetical protein
VLVALLAALVLAQPAAAGGVQSSNIDTPADGFHFYDDQSSGTAFTVHGTATNIAPSVDIDCYPGGGTVNVLASGVPVTAGEFSASISEAVAFTGIPDTCVLRAVPHGDGTARPPGDPSDPYQGPRVAESWNSDEIFDTEYFDYFNTGFAGQLELYPAGYYGLYSSNLFASDSDVKSEQLFDADGYLPSGDQQLDGQAADLASSDTGSTGVPPINVTRSFDNATGAMTITDREALVKCADGPCSSYVTAGVELDRTWKTGHDGLTASQTDTWRSTDGASHQLDATYAQGFHTSSATGAFLFPGSSGFQDYAKTDSVVLPHGPGTVFVKEDHTTPDAGDSTHPQGAVTYASAPDSAAVFAWSDQTNPNYSEWDSHYIRTIPANGSVTLRFAYAQAVALSDVQAFAQEAIASWAPSLAITSPGDGSNSTTPTVTVAGSATDDAGIASLTVNGHGVTVNGDGSWQTPVTLTAGANTITAVVTDPDGYSSQKQITVRYVPPSPPPPAAAHLSLRAPHATSNGVTFRLSCSGATCSGSGTLTAIELVRKPGGKLVGVAVRKVKKTVTVGRASFSVRAGGAKTVRIKLNARGRRLLKRFKHLPVRLTVKYKSAGKLTKVPVKKVTIRTKHRRR